MNKTLDEKLQRLVELISTLKKASDAGEDIVTGLVEYMELSCELEVEIPSQQYVDNLEDPGIRTAAQKLWDDGTERREGEFAELVSYGWAHDDSMELLSEVIGHRSPLELFREEQSLPVLATDVQMPERIRTLFSEARQCFLLEQYNATVALGRMILEHCVTDIGVRRRLIPEAGTLEAFYKEYPPKEKADTVLGPASPRRQRFREMYNYGSRVIHSSEDAQQEDASFFLNRVAKFVQEEYKIHARGLKP